MSDHFKKIIFQQCVQHSYYRPWAEDKIDELLEISEHNALLRETFKKLLKYSDLQLKHDQLMSDEFKDENLGILNNELVVDKNNYEEPKIEFIIEENDKNEKQIRLNFEFKLNNSDELIKIDLEISKNTYLQMAEELLK